ncbi:MAG: hypothetical protein QW265_04450 [Candidatus Bathyarchaeia archaeon]
MYDELYRAWIEERDNPKLQAIPKDFYERLHKYFSKLSSELSSKDASSTHYIFLKRELEIGRELALNLLDKRFSKILISLFENKEIDLSSLAKEEEPIYKNLNDLRSIHRRIKEYISSEGTSLIIPKKRVLLRFISDTPAIVCIDLRSYGPFKAEDIASLPAENAKVLIKQGIAVNIEAD